MEKLFQFTSKWSNIDSGLKAEPGGVQTQRVGLCLPLLLSPSLSLTPSNRNTDRRVIYLCLRIAKLISSTGSTQHPQLLNLPSCQVCVNTRRGNSHSVVSCFLILHDTFKN